MNTTPENFGALLNFMVAKSPRIVTLILKGCIVLPGN
jgi:hypothetical protein